jgi:hypothetical protein
MLACVSLNVQYQVTNSIESFATMITRVRLLICVSSNTRCDALQSRYFDQILHYNAHLRIVLFTNTSFQVTVPTKYLSALMGMTSLTQVSAFLVEPFD